MVIESNIMEPPITMDPNPSEVELFERYIFSTKHLR